MYEQHNLTDHRPGYVLVAQTTCPIASGETGPWFDGTNIKLRLVGGTDLIFPTRAGTQNLSGAGAVDLTSNTTLLTTASSADAITVPAIPEGQEKTILLGVATTAGDTSVISPTGLLDGSSHTITLKTARIDGVTLKGIGTRATFQPTVGAAPSVINSILRCAHHGSDGNLISLKLVSGTVAQAGTVSVTGNAITVTFLTGVTTITDFEALFSSGVACTAGLVTVSTGGTGATLLTAANDVFGPKYFSGGGTTGSCYIKQYNGTPDIA